MTDQTPPTGEIQGTPDPTLDADRTELEERVAAAEQRAAAAEKAAKDATGSRETRYAAYDKTYLRYVPGTFTSAKAARDAAKDAGVTSVRIDEV